jgi:hypothetical protein
MNDFHFAVVVGIAEYPGISNLNSAQKDAQAFYDWLVDEGGVPSQNIKRVHNSGPFLKVTDGKPTRSDINNALREIHDAAQEKVKPKPLDWQKTRFYLYVSGHGIAPDGSEAALLTANAGKDLWENVPCGDYLEGYQFCQFFHEVVIFADCCRLAKKVEFQGWPFFCDATSRGKVKGMIGFATQLGRLAYEPRNDPNGDDARSYFTQALLEGLKGEAADDIGEINSVTLASYTTRRTRALTAGKRYPQIAEIPVNLQAPIVFRPASRAAPLTKRRHTITIILPAGFVGTVELVDHALQQIAIHKVTGGAWREQLRNGLYEVRPLNSPDGKIFRCGGMFRVLGEDRDVQL